MPISANHSAQWAWTPFQGRQLKILSKDYFQVSINIFSLNTQITSVKQIQLLLLKSQREVGSSGVFLLSLLPEIIQLIVDTERHISQISSMCPNPSGAGGVTLHVLWIPGIWVKDAVQCQEEAMPPLLTAFPMGIEIPHIPSLHRVTLLGRS